MNKFKKISIVLFVGLVVFTTTSFAGKGKVNAPNGLIFRKEPSKSAEVIMTISDGKEVELIEKTGEWYKVKYEDNEGYLFAEYVKPEEQQEKLEEETEKGATEETSQEQVEIPNINFEDTLYPKKQNAKADLKVYLIPSITSQIIANIAKDTEITINYRVSNWVNVTSGDINGWVRKYFTEEEIVEKLETTKTEDEQKTKSSEQEKPEEKKGESEQNIINNKKGYVDVSSSANIREQANTSSKIINTLLRNTEVKVIGEEGDFYQIEWHDIKGYMAKSLISEKPVEEVTSRSSVERKTETVKEEVKNVESNKEPVVDVTDSDVVTFAKKYLGYKYVSAGTKPSTGFDCSGFTYFVFNSCGYSLNRSCDVQAKTGTAVARKDLASGDLIFFNNGANGNIGHVGIYIGDGQFIHASSYGKGVKISTLNNGYYDNYYGSARRITK